MLPQWVIEKKRDGMALSEEEIRYFINGYSTGDIPDYQMAALAMAIYLKGMTFEETAILTDAMLHSGDLVDTSSISIYKVDKHSTGGIGDKVSLVLAPLMACCGLAVPMISGRGLGITGGTLDKLESIPGYRTDLSDAEFLDIVNRCGCCITGQTGQLAPADKKLYALRDVTATVPSIPLITGSIMCKKLAEGIDGLVLDVKWGSGAFMKSFEDARELARNMVEVGTRMGKDMAALLTDMDEPLGCTAGNAVEVAESVQTLRGEGPPDLVEVTFALCAQMLKLAGAAASEADARKTLQEHIDSGRGFEKFKEMVTLQGGDASVLDDLSKLPSAQATETITASKAGYVGAVKAEEVGRAVLLLGAGRTRTDDAVDFAVGATGLVKSGTQVAKGAPLVTLHANDPKRLADAKAMISDAFVIQDEAPDQRTLVFETIEKKRGRME